MAINPFDLIEPTWRSLADLEYGYWVVKFGEALEKHEEHQGENAIPPPLAGPAKIKDGGNQMIALASAAEGGDRYKGAERDVFRPKIDLQVSATISWVVVRSVLENKPSIRANLPLEEKKKEKKSVRSGAQAGITTPTKVKITRSDEHSGTAYVGVARIFGASMYYVQYSQGNPADETAWIDGGQSDSCRKIPVPGLKPGEIYHFRVRCFGAGHYSAWSQVVTIRIL